jgi:hypothetical protein
MQMTCKLPDHAAAVEALLEGFVRCCQLCIEAGLAPPDPMDTRVEYRLEGYGQEDWKLPQNVIRDGWGDCEDMAGWRAGGYRATGEDPNARVVVVKTGESKLHAVVERGDGALEDVCRELRDRKRNVMLGGGGVSKTGSGGSGGGGGSGNPPPAAPPPGGTPTSSNPNYVQKHERINATSDFYNRMLKEHPSTQGLYDAMDIRAQRGESGPITATFGKPKSTAVYNSPEEADAAGIDPNTGQRYTATYSPQIDPNDPSTWPPFNPSDPSTWPYYGYDPSQMYGGGYYGGGFGGGFGGGMEPPPWTGYGYEGADPYAGGFPWETPPYPDELNPLTEWRAEADGDW